MLGRMQTPLVAARRSPPLPKPPLGTRSFASSGRLVATDTAQWLFDAMTPEHGFMLQNNGAHAMFITDADPALDGGFRVEPQTLFVTPVQYSPKGGVCVWGTKGDAFTARGW